MNNKVKAITYDALFVALTTALILLFKYVLSILDISIPIIICALIGIRYHKESVMRMAIVSICILLISFLYLDLYSVLVFVFPGLIMGILSHFIVRIFLNLPYYLSSTTIYFIVNCLIEWMYAKLILSTDFISYLSTSLELPGSLGESITSSTLIIIFLAYNLVVSFMQAVIVRLGVIIYERITKRIKK